MGARESKEEGTDALCQVQQKDRGDEVCEEMVGLAKGWFLLILE